MGLGKTIQTISVLCHLSRDDAVGHHSHFARQTSYFAMVRGRACLVALVTVVLVRVKLVMVMLVTVVLVTVVFGRTQHIYDLSLRGQAWWWHKLLGSKCRNKKYPQQITTPPLGLPHAEKNIL